MFNTKEPEMNLSTCKTIGKSGMRHHLTITELQKFDHIAVLNKKIMNFYGMFYKNKINIKKSSNWFFFLFVCSLQNSNF